MTLQQWATLIIAMLSIGGSILGGLRWYIGFQIKPIQEAVEDIRKETKTNGGSSMRDEIRSIKRENEEAKELRKATSDKLDHLYDIFVEYASRPRN